MRLIKGWRTVLARAWSVRFIVLAALLSGLEAVIPFFSVHPAIVFAVVVAAFVSRFLPQGIDHE